MNSESLQPVLEDPDLVEPEAPATATGGIEEGI